MTNFSHLLTDVSLDIANALLPDETWVVGGSIRDAIHDDLFKSGRKSNDIDFATTATPEQVLERVKHLGYAYIFGSDEEGSHHTVKLNIGKGPLDLRQYDITTVENIHTDLARRDLTINAMALGMDGVLIDPFAGADHLKEQVVLFNGDMEQRIAEDPIRILRYIRFSHIFAKDPALSLDLLSEFNPESVTFTRLWNEFSKMVLVENSDLFLHRVLSYCLPWDAPMTPRWIAKVRQLTTAPEVLFCIATDTESPNKISDFKTMFKWSSLAAARAKCVMKFVYFHGSLIELKQYVAVHEYPPSWVCLGLRIGDNADYAKKLESWRVPVFPIPDHVIDFPRDILFQLKMEWSESLYRLNKDQLMARAQQYAAI